MSLTLIIIIATVIISISAFNNAEVYNKLILWPKAMYKPSEYYRMLTSGFIHADVMHLGFNMFTLYFFGKNVEFVLQEMLGKPVGFYIFLYLSGIIIASLPSFIKHRNNSYYRALGASGGVGSVIFFCVYYFPWQKIYLFGIVSIPGIIFAGLYLAYSWYMAKKGNDNIGHDAHFYGSLYGLLFGLAIDPTHGQYFIDQITHPQF